MFKQIDWLMNEAGDIEGVEAVKNMVGENTRLITCLANWNKQDPKVVVPNAIEAGIGLYGFTKPGTNSLLPPINKYLESPVDSLKGDDKNIAVLARVFNGYSLSYTKD